MDPPPRNPTHPPTHRLTCSFLPHSHPCWPGAGPEERTGVFALCIIRRPSDGKFLMTQEYAGKELTEAGSGSMEVVTLYATWIA